MPTSLEKKKEERAEKLKINVKNYKNKIYKNKGLHLRLKKKDRMKKRLYWEIKKKKKKNRQRLNWRRTGERKEKENKSIERNKNQNLFCARLKR